MEVSGGSDPVSETTFDVRADTMPARIALDLDSVTLVEGTDSLLRVAGAQDRYGNAIAAGTLPVVYSTLDSAVARVVPQGATGAFTVRAVAPGETRIVATSRGVADTVAVTVERFVPPGTFRSVSAGGSFACGVAVDGGGVLCWGADDFGQLGNGPAGASAAPVAVRGLPGAADTVVAGGSSACALVGGDAWCWGENTFGQLGDGTMDNAEAPVRVQLPAGTRATALTVGIAHACALDGAGAAWCWGDNSFGELGDGGNPGTGTPVPAAVPAGVSFRAIASGQDAIHTCAVATDGRLWCWGFNQFGQLGLGDSADPFAVFVPTQVVGTVRFRSVSASQFHTCAAAEDGTPYCWGDGSSGQASGGNVPAPVSTTERFAAVSTGFAHSCGVRADGAVFCWGADGAGQLGDGPADASGGTVVRVAGNVAFATVEAGLEFTCARGADNEAYCWGSNAAGQLGNGTSGDAQPAPVRVQPPAAAGAAPVRSIAPRDRVRALRTPAVQRLCARLNARGKAMTGGVCR